MATPAVAGFAPRPVESVAILRSDRCRRRTSRDSGAGLIHIAAAQVLPPGGGPCEALDVVHDMPADRDARDRYFIDGWTEQQADRLETRNGAYEDDGLERAFRKRLRKHREDFAPPR